MTQSAEQILRSFLLRYGPSAGEEGPLLFVREVLGVTEDPWQEDMLRAAGRAERRISVRACHGPGKTAVAAWLVVHRLTCFFPQHTVVTAPSQSQLQSGLVKEVKTWMDKLPEAIRELFEVRKMDIRLRSKPDHSWFEARTSRAENPEALQGVHCEGGTVLIIVDEASGVPEAVFEAAIGSMSGEFCTTVLLSNPTRTSGFFFDTHHRSKHKWYTLHVSHQDSRRVTEDFVEMVAAQYGRDSSAFRIRALGEFPRSDDDTVIPYELVRAAQDRDIEIPDDLLYVWGLDIARFGDDKTALVQRSNLDTQVLTIRERLDLMEVVGLVKRRWQELPEHGRPQMIYVDSIGLGAGVADRLRELGLPVADINVGESRMDTEMYRDLRSELWFAGKTWLERRNTKLPAPNPNLDPREDPAEILASELVAPRFQYMSNGAVHVEPKPQMKKRGHASPNVADAFLLTFADGAAVALMGSSGAGASWNTPLSRGLPVV